MNCATYLLFQCREATTSPLLATGSKSLVHLSSPATLGKDLILLNSVVARSHMVPSLIASLAVRLMQAVIDGHLKKPSRIDKLSKFGTVFVASMVSRSWGYSLPLGCMKSLSGSMTRRVVLRDMLSPAPVWKS